MTEVPNQALSAIKSLKETWMKCQKFHSINARTAGFSIFLGLIPIAVLIWLFNSIVTLSNDAILPYLVNLAIRAIGIAIFLPFLLIPFRLTTSRDNYLLNFQGIREAIKTYPKFLWFSFVCSFYYALIYAICFGLPGLASDPILRLVWIVLLNYWIAIVLPVPILAMVQETSILKAIKLSYKHFHDLRWNIYLLALVLFAINALALILGVLGLLITLPLSWFAIRDYTFRLMDHNLLEYRR